MRFPVLAGIVTLFLSVYFPLNAQNVSPVLSAQSAYSNGEYDKVVGLLRYYCDSHPADITASGLLANSFVALKEFTSALAVVERLLKVKPENKEFLRLAGSLTMILQLHKSATNYLERYCSLSQCGNEENELLYLAWYNYGVEEFNAKRFENAIQNFRKATSYKKGTAAVYKTIISLLLQLGKNEQATKEVQRVIALYPDNREFRDLHIDLLLQTQNYIAAVLAAKELQKQFPHDVASALKTGLTLRYANKVDEAFRLYDSLLVRFPQEEKIYEAMIEYYDLFPEKSSVRSVYRRQLLQFPQRFELYGKMALSCEAESMWDSARYYYEKQFEGDSSVLALIARVNTFTAQKQYNNAAEASLEVLKFFPGNNDGMGLFAVSLDKAGRTGEALQAYQQWANRFDYDEVPALTMGIFLLNNGLIDSAEVMLQRAKRNNAKNPSPYFFLATVYRSKQDTARTVYHLKRALDRGITRKSLLQQQIVAGMKDKEGGLDLRAAKAVSPQSAGYKEVIQLLRKVVLFLEEFLSVQDYRYLIEEMRLLYPTESTLLMAQAALFYKEGKTDEAIQVYNNILKYSNRLAEPHIALARIYADQKNYLQAVQILKRAIGAEPENEAAYTLIILYAKEAGLLNLLADEWMMIFRTNPTDAVLKNRLIEALQKCGRSQEALHIASLK